MAPVPDSSAARMREPRDSLTSGLFLYRCPSAGCEVQGYSPEQTSDDESSYKTVTCLMCTQSHLVNPAAGIVSGDDD